MGGDIRQGCIFSTDLAVIDELEDKEGISIGGININNIGYAHDTVLIADTKDTVIQVGRWFERRSQYTKQ